MTALLTESLQLLAGAPNGTKKLRELILELAVRGKLVPQDPSDEPASELLKRIAEEKARLVAEGKIKKQKPLAEIAEDEKPFELPRGWQWFRLAKGVIKLTDGEHLSPPKAPSGMPLLTAKDVTDSGVLFESTQFVTVENGLKYRERCNPARGDILICSRGTIGRCAAVETDQVFCLMGSVILVKPSVNTFYRYMLRYLQTTLAQLWMLGASSATAVSALYLKDVANCLVPLPPLAEQHRIVAKVDELMALCDRLETQQAGAESAHAQLVQALLDSLTQTSDATELATNWDRLAEHFHTLFTTESSIDKLKQTLLQLAVMGKLVPQEPSDEPANKLLRRISEDKARLVEEGKLKKQRPPAQITEAEKSFELPEKWEWVRLEEIAQVGTGATPLRTNPKYFAPATINWVTSGETSQDYIHESEQKVAPLALTETNLTVYPPHTLIVAMYGQGKTRGQISELLIDACTNQACAAIQLLDQNESHRKFVKYFFVKSYDDIRLLAAGGAQPNLNLGKIKETVLPLPPVIEQHRIVAKLDQLMILCDQLKARLTQARQLNEQLASTLVERALTEDSQ
ncbi:type I restriction endonuclease EcoAI subunit S [Pseudomonas sp. St316]|nr:restriction endonuclease subunit S [Pseudomonas sp. St316]BBP61594.1 type I restriction endonuclease EcoAI subunit S [Pseudomonas sp. St316]